MKSGILRCYIQTLKLRANAPFPSELARRPAMERAILRRLADECQQGAAVRLRAGRRLGCLGLQLVPEDH